MWNKQFLINKIFRLTCVTIWKMLIGFTKPECQIYNFLDATIYIKYKYYTFENYTILKNIYTIIIYI